MPNKWERERESGTRESFNGRKENREKRRKREKERQKIERVSVRGCETARKRKSANEMDFRDEEEGERDRREDNRMRERRRDFGEDKERNWIEREMQRYR